MEYPRSSLRSDSSKRRVRSKGPQRYSRLGRPKSPLFIRILSLIPPISFNYGFTFVSTSSLETIKAAHDVVISRWISDVTFKSESQVIKDIRIPWEAVRVQTAGLPYTGSTPASGHDEMDRVWMNVS